MNTKIILLLTAVIWASSCFAEKLTFTGTTDKNPLLYKSGEEMVFTVTLVDQNNDNKAVKGKMLVWERKGDDGKTEKGEVLSDVPLTVKTSIAQPGFVRLTVNVLDGNGKPLSGKNEKFDGGAGADVNCIPVYPLPKDFNEFWNHEIQKLYDTPYKTKLTDVHSNDPRISVMKFEISTFAGERPTTGFIGIPKDAKEKSLPATIFVEGYGFGATPLSYLCATVGKGEIVIAITRHGEDPDRDKDYYERLSKNEMKCFGFRNNDGKYTSDFYKMIIRDLRAVQYLKSCPEWDGKNISACGGSMGGFRAIAIAGLDSAVTKCNANIPWLADLAGTCKYNRQTGWRPAFTEPLGYFDTANLATRVKCPVEMTMNLGDYVCPPSGEIILFNNFKGKKKLTVSQNAGHGSAYGVDTRKYVFTQEIK